MTGICIISAVAGPYGIEEPPSPGEDVNPLFQRIGYLYSQSTTVSLSVVGSGGNLGAITDTRMIAGASTSQTSAEGGFASEAATPDISSILGASYARISQTVGSAPTLPVDTDLHRFPIMNMATPGVLQAMTLQDCYDYFIIPTLANITSGTISALAGGAYHISTSSSVAGSTLVSATPVYVDTRANAAAYTAGGIPETLDQPTTINNYYLHKVTPAANTPSFMPLYWDYNGGYLKEMPLSMFDDIFGPMIQAAVVNGSGEVGVDLKIRYSINGSGTTMGSVMTDTILSGSSAAGYNQRFVSISDYRTQEFPNGTPVANSTNALRIATSN